MSNKATGLMNHFKNLLLTGLFVVVPILAAVWLSWWIYNELTVWAIGLAEKIHMPGFEGEKFSFWLGHGMRLLALLLMVAALLVVGQLTKLTLGRKLINLGQTILMHLPLVNFIYSTCKQIADAMQSSSGGMFHQVVLIEYPKENSYTIGFVTNENTDPNEITEVLGKQMISVFIPTTPNPTSGFLLLIPQEKCIFLKMSVSDAMKLIVSVGTVLPEQKPGRGK